MIDMPYNYYDEKITIQWWFDDNKSQTNESHYVVCLW